MRIFSPSRVACSINTTRARAGRRPPHHAGVGAGDIEAIGI
jgi:hypothetical protein